MKQKKIIIMIAVILSIGVIAFLFTGKLKNGAPLWADRSLKHPEIKAILEKIEKSPVPAVAEEDIFVLKTNHGILKAMLYPDIAPRHAANFKRLAVNGFFDGTQFHRIIKGFMIQGGDLFTRDNDPGNDGTGGPGYQIDAEFSKIPHVRGIISMARAQDINSAGSQFFIMLGNHSFLDGKYTVFGEIVEGFETLAKIEEVAVTYSFTREKSRPLDPVILESVTLEKNNGQYKISLRK